MSNVLFPKACESCAAPGWLPWLAALAMGLGCLGLTAVVGPHVPLAPWAGYLVGFGMLVGSTLAAAALAPVWRGTAWGWLLLALVALAWVRLAGLKGLPAAMLVTGALWWVATPVGAAVGARVERPGHLLMVVIVSALADVWSVFHPAGPSAAVLADSAVLSLVALSWPLPGTRAIEPLLGVGDVVFVALYLRAARVHGLGVWRMAGSLSLGFALTLFFVVTLAQPIPALPGLGLAVVVCHPAARRLPASEWRVVWGALLFAGAVGLAWWWSLGRPAP